MILLVHLFIGAVITTKIQNLFFLVILAMLFHYLLDIIPHTEYSIKSIQRKRWNKSFFDFVKISIDLFSGLLLILVAQKITGVNYPVLFIGAFFGILPDALTIGYFLFPNNCILKSHSDFHKKLHFLNNKKLPSFLGVFTQILIVVLGFIFL